MCVLCHWTCLNHSFLSFYSVISAMTKLNLYFTVIGLFHPAKESNQKKSECPLTKWQVFISLSGISINFSESWMKDWFPSSSVLEHFEVSWSLGTNPFFRGFLRSGNRTYKCFASFFFHYSCFFRLHPLKLRLRIVCLIIHSVTVTTHIVYVRKLFFCAIRAVRTFFDWNLIS